MERQKFVKYLCELWERRNTDFDNLWTGAGDEFKEELEKRRHIMEQFKQHFSCRNAFSDKNIPDVSDEKEVENKYICKECADDACHLIVIGNSYPPEQCPFWKGYKANWEQNNNEREQE